MGNKPKTETWTPATPLRVMAFVRSLVPEFKLVKIGDKPKISDIQNVLSMLADPVDRSNEIVRQWRNGEVKPSKGAIAKIERELPEAVAWLEPDIHSSPSRRLLCALDIWGSKIDSDTRKLDTASETISVKSGLSALAKHWAPVVIVDEDMSICGSVIPRLKRIVPNQVPLDIYQPSNPLSLMDFMFRCGAYLELSDDEFNDWAIDLASLTLITGAYYEGISSVDRYQSGMPAAYSGLAFRVFFRGHGNWPNIESLKSVLEGDSNFDGSINYAERLIQAYKALNKVLISFGSDVSIAKVLTERIEDRNAMWPIKTHDNTFARSDLASK